MKSRQRAARLLVATGLVGACLLPAAAAGAHVTVSPGEASVGSFSVLTFRVPNERQTQTTSVEIDFPADHPIPFVSVEPVPGWNVNVEKTTLPTPLDAEGRQITEAVSKVTWSGGTISAGQFQQFNVSAGPLPDAKTLEFKAIQTYSDGEVVRWIDPVPESGEEPERPAPTLTLTPAKGDGHGGGTSTDEAKAGDEAMTTGSKSNDSGTDALSIVALVVGGLGVVLGGIALARGGRAKSAA